MSHFSRNARYDKITGGDHFLVRITAQGDVRNVSVTDVVEYLKDQGLNGFQVNNFQLIPTTFDKLPTNPAVGLRAFITDCSGNVFGDFAAAGGAYAVPVYYDGNAWMVG